MFIVDEAWSLECYHAIFSHDMQVSRLLSEKCKSSASAFIFYAKMERKYDAFYKYIRFMRY